MTGTFASPHAASAPSRRRGLLYALAAGLALSVGPLLVRVVEAADPWQIVVYRSTALGAALFLFLCFRYGRRVFAAYRAIGRLGFLGAAILSLSFPSYVLAIVNTSVAGALFVMSAFPVLCAGFGWLFLRERVGARTWLAIAGTAIGIAIMVNEGIGAGSAFGSAAALGTAVAMALYTVTVRRLGAKDMLPALSLAGFMAGIEGAAMVGDFGIGARDLALSVLMGGGQVALGFALYTLAARHAPAAEVALVGLAEVVFGPLIVWAALGEVPSVVTIAGGAVVLVSVAGFAAAGLRESRASPAARRLAPPRPPAPVPRGDLGSAMADALRMAAVRSEEPANAVGRMVRPKRPRHARPAPVGAADARPDPRHAPHGTRAETTARDSRESGGAPAAVRETPAAVAAPSLAVSVEQAVARALEPTLRDWAGRAVPGVVERMVRREIRAILRRGLAGRDGGA